MIACEMKIQSISVVIPAYRAAGKLPIVIAGIPTQISWIIIVDDASPDNTLDIARQCAETDPRVIVLSHTVNQGVGGAMITGYRESLRLGAQISIKMDSDDQMDPAYLPTLLQPIMLNKADYVKGNRFIRLDWIRQMPFLRRIGNIGLSFMVKLASGYWNIFDPTNGYTAIRTSLIDQLDLHHIDKRYFFETSMLIELGLLRAVVRDVYIPARYQDEESSLSELDALIRFPKKLVKGFLNRIFVQYFLRDFSVFSVLSIIGLPLSIFGLVFGSVNWWVSIRSGVPATTGTVMLAVLPLILGIQFLLQAVMLDIQRIPTEPIFPQENNS
jgi:dolichol-phosphate mannosyltransferase